MCRLPSIGGKGGYVHGVEHIQTSDRQNSIGVGGLCKQEVNPRRPPYTPCLGQGCEPSKAHTYSRVYTTQEMWCSMTRTHLPRTATDYQALAPMPCPKGLRRTLIMHHHEPPRRRCRDSLALGRRDSHELRDDAPLLPTPVPSSRTRRNPGAL